MESIKRLVIYEYNDLQTLPEYVEFALRELSDIASDLFIISQNNDLNFSMTKTIKLFNKYSDISCDLKKYQQIIIMNDSLYGPIYSLDSLLNLLNENEFLTLDGDFNDFLALNTQNFSNEDLNKLLINKEMFLKEFCNNLNLTLFVTNKHEIDKNISVNKLPFISKKFFINNDSLFWNYRTKFTFNYIDEKTSYNADLIKKDLISLHKPGVIDKAFHLNYILPSKQLLNSHLDVCKEKTALIMYIFAENLIEYCLHYAKSMPEYIDIYIVSTSKNTLENIKKIFTALNNKIFYRIQENRGRDNTALLITCKDVIKNYDYICFVHSKTASHFKTNIIGDNFRMHCFESLLASSVYVKNIINTFNNDSDLGLLIPLPPEMPPYNVISNEWMNNYNNAVDFLKSRLNLNLALEKNNPMCAFGGMFWARTKALDYLIKANLTFEDFPSEPLEDIDGLLTHSIERILPVLVSLAGFYSAYTAPDYYAAVYIGNLKHKLSTTKNELKKYNSLGYLWSEFCKKLFKIK